MPNTSRVATTVLWIALLGTLILSCEASSVPSTLSYYRQKHHACNRSTKSCCLDLRGGSGRGGGYGGNDAPYDYGRRYDDYPQQQQQYSYNDDDDDDHQNRRYYDDNNYGRYEEEDGGYYEEDYRRRSSSSRRPSSGSGSGSGSFASNLPNLKNHRRLGVMLVGAGGMFMMAGIASFFNKFLLRIAHILLCTGAPMIVGPGRVAGYVLQPKKARATITFGLGLFLVLVGHPFFGMILEVFGFLNLFGNLFPIVKVMLRSVPGVGNLFGGNGDSNRSKQRRSYDDDYHNDGGRRERYADENPERYY